ncbi:MAG: hypothetical protein Sylvanvirus19_6 [Sylvanvirus sp.]|uniref:Uncharacterized protein n=1 Tax=Sylvanvirus sp. TaxID=2487774 RepID=A0A3G5AL24_9VIRU|nr:MAG: hypothetical protein Sylvanvirus19_6 [Sylvanvirus sp.]
MNKVSESVFGHFLPWALICHFCEFEELFHLSKCNRLLARVLRCRESWSFFEFDEYKLMWFFKLESDQVSLFLNKFILHIDKWKSSTEHPLWRPSKYMNTTLKRNINHLVTFGNVAEHVFLPFILSEYSTTMSLFRSLRCIDLQNSRSSLPMFLDHSLPHIVELRVKNALSWRWIVHIFPNLKRLHIDHVFENAHMISTELLDVIVVFLNGLDKLKFGGWTCDEVLLTCLYDLELNPLTSKMKNILYEHLMSRYYKEANDEYNLSLNILYRTWNELAQTSPIPLLY